MAVGDRSLTFALKLAMSGAYARETATGGNSPGTFSIPLLVNYSTSGTGDNQGDRFYRASGTVTTAETAIDLAGSVSDDYGQTITFAELRGMILVNTMTAITDGTLIYGNASANQFLGFTGAAAHTIKIQPASWACFATTLNGSGAVSAGSTDNIRLSSSAGSVTYTLVLWGASA